MQGCASNVRSVIVLVADTCQNCTANQITMHASTFQQFMAPQSQGAVNATYRQVRAAGKQIRRVAHWSALNDLVQLSNGIQLLQAAVHCLICTQRAMAFKGINPKGRNPQRTKIVVELVQC